MDRAGAVKDSIEDAVGEELDSLGVADCAFAIVLDTGQIVRSRGAGEQGFGKDVGGGDGVLDCDVDADASDG